MRSALLTRFASLAVAASLAPGQTDWPVYGGDPGATRYSTLKQIDASNVGRLRRAWTFHTGKPGSEAIPLVVAGVMYIAAPNGIFAIDAGTGALRWKYPAEKVALRGLAYWPGARDAHPRLFVGIGADLVAIDAVTGGPARGFGREGSLDLRQGVSADPAHDVMALQSPPAIYRDIVITGSVPNEGAPSRGAYGDIRGWSARTGKLLWTFHTVPRPGEPGHETWEGDSWKQRSGTNAWGFLTVDVERGLVFVPLGSPTSDFNGSDRRGQGLYGNSLVALDASTGALKWYRQLVHHDLWDYDLAAPPILIDAGPPGRSVPAVAQITKMGLAFIFDRRTGEPVFGMEERPVPQTEVPGEQTWPTQPFPVKPPPLAKNTFQPSDLYSLTPEHAAFCRDLFEKNRMVPGGPYTPMPLEGNALFFPSTLGGGNWGGFSSDPALGLIFTNIMNIGQWGHVEKRADPKTGVETWVRTSAFGPYARFWNPATRVPCTNPPFGELVAVDIRTGDIAWRTPLGTVPELEARGVRNTGAVNLGGSLATAGGLVFIAAANDATFRAFESKTGRLVWQHPIDANGHTAPVTYTGRNGKQYVAIYAGGGGGFFGGTPSDSVIAFALDAAGAGPSEVARRPAAPAPERSAAVSTPAVLPPGPGLELVRARCGRPCHEFSTVAGQRMTRAEWANVVENMIARGARVSPAEARAIADYLGRNLGR